MLWLYILNSGTACLENKVIDMEMRFLKHGELQDDEIIEALRGSVDDYEDGSISEVRDLLVEIVHAIDEWVCNYRI